MNAKWLVIPFLFLANLYGIAQHNPLSYPVTLSQTEVPMSLQAFLERIEKQAGFQFFFHPDWINYLSVTSAYQRMPLGNVLDQLLAGSRLSYVVLHDRGIILLQDPTFYLEREKVLAYATAARKQVVQVQIGNPAEYRPNQKVRLYGVVTDEKNSSGVREASVSVINTPEGTVTTEKGNYELFLPPGDYLLSFRHNNYAEKIIDLKLYASGSLPVELNEVAIILDEVVIAEQGMVNQSIGQVTLNLTDVKRSSPMLGSADIIKQLQLQAGVTTIGEVATGFNVRGGSVDQNLVLYDGMPVFNTAHAIGFFPAFNADVLKHVGFYKSAVPAEFGGRVSSVLSVTAQEGSMEEWSGGGAIGLLAADVHVDGPIRKDKTTIAASWRTSYADWMLNLVNANYSSLQNSQVAFHDGSVKIAHKFTDRSRLSLSAYTSTDRLQLTNDTLFQWTNLVTSLRWDKEAKHNLYYSVSLGFGAYGYSMEEPDPAQAFILKYRISYPTLKIDFNQSKGRPRSFGAQVTAYTFNPGTLERTSPESVISPIDIKDESAWESALYYSETFRLGERYFIDLGLRYAFYARVGPGTTYLYKPGEPREVHTIVDSVVYARGEIMQTYSGPEPRLAVRYQITNTSSLKLGYNRIYQFIHLISNTAAVTPVDVWQASNYYFRPQLADQIAGGYFRSLREGTVEFSGELFYKHIDNILEFKDGASLILNKYMETALLSGISKSYGAEISINKIRGRFTGAFNYTWSRSLRKVDGADEREQINSGNWYAANFDQPHVVNTQWRYGITRRHFFSGTFVYHTGRPISLPEQVYYIDQIGVSDFPERNTFRLPDYHRLDLAFIIEGNHKRKKIMDGTWIFSMYNVYARRNAYSVFFKMDENGILKPYQLSVVGTIIPTITYKFSF